jgi:uncharacterized membrane protein YhaH (DUF805 family)
MVYCNAILAGAKTSRLHAMSLRTVARFMGGLFAALMICAVTAWGVLAIYFGDSHTSLLQTLLASLFGVVGLVAVIALGSRRWRRKSSAIFTILFTLLLIWWLNISPSNQRHWQADVAKLPYATIDGDQVTMHNIRNFAYRSETDYIPAYYTKTYDLKELESVDLFAVYWMGPAIAHTIISFGFADQDYLAVSIEARKEQDEGYSTIKGFFRQYELIYIVADERDVIRLRTDFRSAPPEDVYRYRLIGSPENARHFFLEYVAAINALKEHPRFYNTLMTNCTNVIWVHTLTNPGHLPFSWELLASGYLPQYLYANGRLDTSLPFAQLTAKGYINPIAHRFGDAADFSRRIRDSVVP